MIGVNTTVVPLVRTRHGPGGWMETIARSGKANPFAIRLIHRLVVTPRGHSVLIGIDKPQHMRRQIALGIKSLILLLKINALQIQRANRLHFFRR